MMINGKKYSWQSITTALPHGEAIDIKDISYDEGIEKEALYGKGNKPVGYGVKNQSSTAKITLRREEVDKWEKHSGKSVLNLPPFPITVSYGDDELPTVTDELRQCVVTNKSGMGAAQGDGEITVDLDLTVLGGIKYNDVEA